MFLHQESRALALLEEAAIRVLTAMPFAEAIQSTRVPCAGLHKVGDLEFEMAP